MAGKPRYLTKDDVPQSYIDKETAFLKKQAIESGKPEKIAEKVAMGQLHKILEDVVLPQQKYLHDLTGKKSVAQVLQEEGKKLGTKLSLSGFQSFSLDPTDSDHES